MSYTVTQGDLLRAETDAIVNAVNCVGVMGKGIALQFKKKWPENFRDYKRACDAGEVRPGKVHVHEMGTLAGRPHFIVNFPTKDHWRDGSKMEFVEEGLRDLVRVVKSVGIRSIAIPALGCGHGGLDWAEVEPRVKAAFEPLAGEVEVRVFAPGPPVGGD
jgi:O-acetyl-ADP-ribose deacetylase (regulator of RNase III)